jgi:hypothetical protein
VTALVAEDKLKRACYKLFAFRHATARLARDNVIYTNRGTFGTLRLGYRRLFEFIRKMRPVAGRSPFLSPVCLLGPRPVRPIVLNSAFFIGKDIVSRHDFFQFLSGSLIIWISVGMVLKDQSSIGALDFFRRRLSAYTQKRVIVGRIVQRLLPLEFTGSPSRKKI